MYPFFTSKKCVKKTILAPLSRSSLSNICKSRANFSSVLTIMLKAIPCPMILEKRNPANSKSARVTKFRSCI